MRGHSRAEVSGMAGCLGMNAYAGEALDDCVDDIEHLILSRLAPGIEKRPLMASAPRPVDKPAKQPIPYSCHE